jgi:hypothetical protein
VQYRQRVHAKDRSSMMDGFFCMYQVLLRYYFWKTRQWKIDGFFFFFIFINLFLLCILKSNLLLSAFCPKQTDIAGPSCGSKLPPQCSSPALLHNNRDLVN